MSKLNTLNTWPQIVKIYGLSTFVLLALMSLMLLLPAETSRYWLREGGLIETVSALSYLGVIAYVFWVFKPHFWRRYHYLLILLLMFCFRELDFDKRFTEVGILKSQFLLSQQVPLMQKLLGGLVLLILIYSTARALFTHGLRVIQDSLRPTVQSVGVLLGVAAIVVSKTLDGLERKLQGLGFEVNNWLTQNASAFEEIIELFIPLYFLLAFWGFAKMAHNQSWLRKTVS
ncbi:MAG: hypothetical protein JXR44_07860 [Thiotrichales bacterium]|nr:hypothetical protein [Thiotrichales bacterium]